MSARQNTNSGNFGSYHHHHGYNNYNNSLQNRTPRGERVQLSRNGKKIVHRDRTVTTLTGQGEDDSEFFAAHRNEFAQPQAQAYTPEEAQNHNQNQNQTQATFPSLISPGISSNFNQVELMSPNNNNNSVTSTTTTNPSSSSSTFGYGYNSFVGPINANPNNLPDAQPPRGYHQPMLSPGKNDLEILENLKERIKKGQHEFFRATPNPLALANLYLGPNHIDSNLEQQVGAQQENFHSNGFIERSTLESGSKTVSGQESNSKNTMTTTDVLNGTSSLPAKPAAGAPAMTSHASIKDERRETFPPDSSFSSSSKYYDPRDSRDNRDRRESFSSFSSSDAQGSSSNPRRGPTGAEYASIRYGPIRDLRDGKDDRDRDRERDREKEREIDRDRDRDRDRRDIRRDSYEASSYQREEYPPPPSSSSVGSLPPPPTNDRYDSNRYPPGDLRLFSFYLSAQRVREQGENRHLSLTHLKYLLEPSASLNTIDRTRACLRLRPHQSN